MNAYDRVLDVLAGGILRLRFVASGELRWAVREEFLLSTPPERAEIRDVVACACDGTAGSHDEASTEFCRAWVLSEHSAKADHYVVQMESGEQATVPRHALRTSAVATGGASLPAAGSCVHALLGMWECAIVHHASDVEGGRVRIVGVPPEGQQSRAYHTSTQELVALDGGDASPSSPMWRMSMGSPVVVCIDSGGYVGCMLHP